MYELCHAMSHMLGRILVSTRDDVSSFSVGVPEALISSHSERSGGEPGAGPGCGVAVGVGDSSGGSFSSFIAVLLLF